MTLKEFDVQMSRFAVSGFLTSSWTDRRLEWLPSDHNGISSLQLYQGDIWTPGFVLWNSDTSLTSMGYDNTPVRAYSNGLIVWSPGQVFVTSCDADVTYFPFDIQRCAMDFTPHGYKMDEINMTIDETFPSKGESTLNTMWEVRQTKMFLTDMNNELMLHVSVTFSRRGLIFVLILILPVVLMSLVNLAVFFIPVEEGNRVDFSTTMLLTISVAMTVVGGYLPESSLPQISLMCYMVSIHVFISMLVMVFTVKSVQIYHRTETDEMSTMSKFLTKVLLGKRREKIGIKTPNKEDITEVKEFERPKWIISSPDDIGKDEVKIDNRAEDDTNQINDVSVTWKDVGSTFDRLSFIFFILLIGILDLVTISMVFLKGGKTPL
ncbi:neuronal acetylcholine receptor subunit alpha-5-like [Mizuhopecten yessoensis]|uniref:Neuronal acetylcholine receptor subunit alpha-5 n=1 Tax=Mizuhopecten yessoensis TaxID=6573 RepID=A0A210Q9J8_MIZYE|nr:neuronal acetylcholine receptor subunit alpha-5-like [Mizuhopecten yessoensis]OWF45406.1 Neuronal acetylcholine receptor subunit alpha-5 [Mizuhopecten yessoensis]